MSLDLDVSKAKTLKKKRMRGQISSCSLMPEITSTENNMLYSTIRSKPLNVDFSGRKNTMIALILKYKSMILKGTEVCVLLLRQRT